MLFRACRSAPRLFRHLGLIATLATLLLTSLIPATTPAALAADPVLVGAGDIATCSGDDDEATAALLDTIDGTVFTTGDNAYNRGTDAEFANCYDPSWGRHKARTYPVPGNHDYATRGAAAYFAYFGERAGDPAKGYYSFNLDAWHVIALNSNCRDVGGCDAGSPQEQWLRADLAAHPARCTVAMWHHPRFSSGKHGNDDRMQAFWQALYEAGADVVLNGHIHSYERFVLQDAVGNADPRGIREFVAGTGGREMYPFEVPPGVNSVVRDASTRGVIKLTLHPTSYDWEFIPVAGGTFRDSGKGTCVSASTKAYLPLVHTSRR
jgi:3',5'-cyclic AMP phosphodiesterase CpdA